MTNSEQVLTVEQEMSFASAAVLSTILASGAEISRLALWKELPPGAAARIGPAISASKIHTLTLGYPRRIAGETPELFRMLALCANTAVEKLCLCNLCVGVGCVCDSICSFPELRSLTIVAQKETSHGSIPSLAAGIGRLCNLESLCIWNVAFDGSDARTLAAALKALPLMSDLRISCADVGVEDCKQIGSLVGLGRIRKLVLGFDRLGDEGVSAIVNAVLASLREHSTCSLQELDLPKNNIGPAGGKRLVELAAHSPRLRSLNVSNNRIGAGFCGLVAQSLLELRVTGCGLGTRGIESMLLDETKKKKKTLPVLKTLRMCWNDAGDTGARAVAQFIIRSGAGATLAELWMRRNGITEAGALELARAFVKAYTLQHVDISGNPVGPRGATAIVDALAAACAVPMVAIGLASCGIGDEEAAGAARLISRRGCRRVDLGRNRIGVAGATAIADSVTDSKCDIQVLGLSGNPLGDAGVTYLLDKVVAMQLQQHRFIGRINIADTETGTAGMMAVQRAAEAHVAIGRLHEGRNGGGGNT